MREFVDKVSQEKNGRPYKFDNWSDHAHNCWKKGTNTYDSGVNVCRVMEYISRVCAPLTEESKGSPTTSYLRTRIAQEILDDSLCNSLAGCIVHFEDSLVPGI